jgi:hydroxyproline O-arabinosyltransferase
MGVDRHFKHGEPIVAQPATAVQRAATGASASAAFSSPPGWPTRGSTVHTLCTSNGSPYTNFQNRIMYATYQVMQREPGGEVHVAFTRILHRTNEDALMQVRV